MHEVRRAEVRARSTPARAARVQSWSRRAWGSGAVRGEARLKARWAFGSVYRRFEAWIDVSRMHCSEILLTTALRVREVPCSIPGTPPNFFQIMLQTTEKKRTN